jgi:hypothetical protein
VIQASKPELPIMRFGDNLLDGSRGAAKSRMIRFDSTSIV